MSADLFTEEAVAAMVHELRTPVTTIRALAELMLDTPEMEEDERRGFLSIIADESRRLGRLVDEVLEAARIGSAEAEWRMEDLDPLALTAEAARLATGLMRERGVELSLDLPATAPPVRGDRDRLLQVLLNLLSNAAKAASGQGGHVALALAPDRDAVTIRVIDNGPGIAPEDREAVFQPFHRLGQTGTGLGLPVSRRIARRHGGSLSVEPSDAGACFALSLPLAEGAA
ncbi:MULTISPECIES: sensor histidine kinase KdpD [unclassified Paracoccus (in: a-proteobacteria)]|uniref:sensor histidine kinase n=1 Tax=unclassified Paracoccus (in: a-proteobacteria) TaxID=2688777 RepID=UPI0015FEEDC1|nr:MULTISPECIES: HAMP domain-containing sensor histidine kinase [unclassified Paracoccus (in: a-proteobacteria)]MBB1491783.1 HAMP domain-containing histidine kinase [Paracoccus sp. MC1854]MBB1496878.1 HAMP domain-containing histidine kinase [Paracoccus sp. MC1862]QQO45502.1 HAMP domain-containing histidine kinase [Paracoccus sp. MC1862]